MSDLGSTMDATITCMRCGAQNERANTRCWSCGHALDDAANADAERGDLELEEVTRALVAEGYEEPFERRGDRLACPRCGTAFHAGPDVLQDAREARDTTTARQDLIVLALTCPNCGAQGYVDADRGDLPIDDSVPAGAPHAGYSATSTDASGGGRVKPGATPEHPLGDDRQHFVVVDDGDNRSLRERGPLLDEEGDDIREYTGEPVETEEGTVIPQQQNVGPGNEAGGGEWPDPHAPPAQ